MPKLRYLDILCVFGIIFISCSCCCAFARIWDVYCGGTEYVTSTDKDTGEVTQTMEKTFEYSNYC
eukprot:TRINITY_DN6894_c0_g1_i1.p2 TRINITY_DN6894_c0_g1~~TRINITY_DN6894_c0_g1_i1.p2  ORF type:complete len:65 (+),score=6.00 TRINITY_DN6894_c0_g1_i1:509-703(+)